MIGTVSLWGQTEVAELLYFFRPPYRAFPSGQSLGAAGLFGKSQPFAPCTFTFRE